MPHLVPQLIFICPPKHTLLNTTHHLRTNVIFFIPSLGPNVSGVLSLGLGSLPMILSFCWGKAGGHAHAECQVAKPGPAITLGRHCRGGGWHVVCLSA